jgi:hypothetical protein
LSNLGTPHQNKTHFSLQLSNMGPILSPSLRCSKGCFEPRCLKLGHGPWCKPTLRSRIKIWVDLGGATGWCWVCYLKPNCWGCWTPIYWPPANKWWWWSWRTLSLGWMRRAHIIVHLRYQEKNYLSVCTFEIGSPDISQIQALRIGVAYLLSALTEVNLATNHHKCQKFAPPIPTRCPLSISVPSPPPTYLLSGFGRLLSSTSYNLPLHNFFRFCQDLTGCKLVAIHLDQPISCILFFKYFFPSVG